MLSDIHATGKNPVARKDDILQAFLDKFEFILNYAEDNQCIILQAGDFFHRPRDWRLLSLVMDLLDVYRVPIYTIYGQHDMYLYSDVEDSPTTLSILHKAGYVNILGKVPVQEDNIRVYGCSWGSKVPKPKKGHNILVIHAGIAATNLYPGHDYKTPNAFLMRHPKYNLVLAGDVHRQFIETYSGRTLVNTGPMMRYDGSKYNMKHKPCAYIWDTSYGTLNKIGIPHGRASKVLTRGHLEKANDFSDALQAFTEEIKKTKHIERSLDIDRIIMKLVKKTKAGSSVKKVLAGVMTDES